MHTSALPEHKMSEMDKLENILDLNLETNDICTEKLEENNFQNSQNVIKIGDYMAI